MTINDLINLITPFAIGNNHFTIQLANMNANGGIQYNNNLIWQTSILKKLERMVFTPSKFIHSSNTDYHTTFTAIKVYFKITVSHSLQYLQLEISFPMNKMENNCFVNFYNNASPTYGIALLLVP